MRSTHESAPGAFLVHDSNFPNELITTRFIDFNYFTVLVSTINSESSGLTKLNNRSWNVLEKTSPVVLLLRVHL